MALNLGGPGAIFWMWMVALVGMATAYSESTLAQLYKTRNEDGEYRGGPAFYIARGLGAPWAGAIFSVCLILAFGLVFNAVQANSIADAMQGAFGFDKIWVGVALAVVTGIVIFGGIRQIARVAEIIVPFMAVIYLAVALYVVAILLSGVFVDYLIGGWLLSQIQRGNTSPWARMAVGALVVSLLMSLPWIGGIVQLIVLLIGFGALVLEQRESKLGFYSAESVA